MLDPLLHFHFQNISIISIASPIFIQPSVFIIVLFYFTHLSYPSYLPLPLYKPSYIYIQKWKITQERKLQLFLLSSVLASDRLSYSHFSAFSLSFSSSTAGDYSASFPLASTMLYQRFHPVSSVSHPDTSSTLF